MTSRDSNIPQNSTYNYTDSFFRIENGIIKGNKLVYGTDHNSYGEYLLERLRANTKLIGQIDGATGKEETFGVMLEKSLKCATWLQQQNVEPGDIIGICTHNQLDMYVPCFASLFIGAVFNPWWHTGITKDMMKHFVNLTNPKILFINEASAFMAAELAKEMNLKLKIIVFGTASGFESLDDILDSQTTENLSKFCCTKISNLEEPAAILYTSGTTGFPKAAVHSNGSLLNFMPKVVKDNETADTIRSMLFSPLAWSTGVSFMLRDAVTNSIRIIYPEFEEEKTFELIEKYKVNQVLLGTSAAVRLERSPLKSKYDLSSLKNLCVTGGTVKKSTQELLAKSFPLAIVSQAYGTTELGCVAMQRPHEMKLGSVGQVLPNVSVKVIDPENGRVLGPNETGEACVKSAFVMTCYYNNPLATSEIIDPEGWLHTGDLVHYDESGHIFITDRAKDLIKFRGNHISPAMVEQTIQLHPDVIEAAVLGVPHEIDDEHPMAFVVKEADSKVTGKEIENLVAEKLPDYMKLRGGVVFIDELPHTFSGKLARNSLRKLLQSITAK